MITEKLLENLGKFYKVPVPKEIITYEEMKAKLVKVTPNADRIIKIIEEESNEYDRRMAFMETTYEEILSGADYSQCENIKQISEVYAHSVLKRLGFI